MEMFVPLAVFAVFAVVIVGFLPSPKRPATRGRQRRRPGGPSVAEVLDHAATSSNDDASTLEPSSSSRPGYDEHLMRHHGLTTHEEHLVRYHGLDAHAAHLHAAGDGHAHAPAVESFAPCDTSASHHGGDFGSGGGDFGGGGGGGDLGGGGDSGGGGCSSD